jgi:hypothetical protein
LNLGGILPANGEEGLTMPIRSPFFRRLGFKTRIE